MPQDIAALLDRCPIPSPSDTPSPARNEHATSSLHPGLATTLATLRADKVHRLANPLTVPTTNPDITYFSQHAADTLFGAQTKRLL